MSPDSDEASVNSKTVEAGLSFVVKTNELEVVQGRTPDLSEMCLWMAVHTDQHKVEH